MSYPRFGLPRHHRQAVVKAPLACAATQSRCPHGQIAPSQHGMPQMVRVNVACDASRHPQCQGIGLSQPQFIPTQETLVKNPIRRSIRACGRSVATLCAILALGWSAAHAAYPENPSSWWFRFRQVAVPTSLGAPSRLNFLKHSVSRSLSRTSRVVAPSLAPTSWPRVRRTATPCWCRPLRTRSTPV